MKISQRKCNKRAEIWAYLSSKTWKNLKRNPKFILKKMIDEYVHLYYDLREYHKDYKYSDDSRLLLGVVGVCHLCNVH